MLQFNIEAQSGEIQYKSEIKDSAVIVSEWSVTVLTQY